MSQNFVNQIAQIKARPEERAFNIWLGVLDNLLSRNTPLATAMHQAGESLQQAQAESGGKLFHPADLYIASVDINILLRRLPEYQQRTSGWSKSQIEMNSRR
jgi:hypothetical protein